MGGRLFNMRAAFCLVLTLFSRTGAAVSEGDGEREYVLTSARGRLCGNAGCPHVLLAGKALKRIGEMFGHLAILDERINGHRVVQTHSRHRVEATSPDTWVFDGKAYRQVSYVIVDRCGLEQWSRRMRKGS